MRILQPEISAAGENSFHAFPCFVVSFQEVTEVPPFKSSHDSLQHTAILVNKLDVTATAFYRCSLYAAVKECCTNREEIFLVYKSLPKIFLAASVPTPRHSASSLVVIHVFCLTVAQVLPHFRWNERKMAGLDEDRCTYTSVAVLLDLK
jgi:hypothetical protein